MDLDVAPEAMIDSLLDSGAITINFDELRLKYTDPSPEGRRVAPRYDIALDVIVLSSNRSFRTTSVNVSISGALLKDILPPDFMTSKSLDIIFVLGPSSPKKRLLFRGKAVGYPHERSQRITFHESGLNAQTDLLIAIEKDQPLNKKKSSSKRTG
jgi:hypothetical protein